MTNVNKVAGTFGRPIEPAGNRVPAGDRPAPGRPAIEVDHIRRKELESIPNPRIAFEASGGSSRAGGSGGQNTSAAKYFMIDRSRTETQPPSLGIPIPGGLAETDTAGGASVADLYDKLFSETADLAAEQSGELGPHEIPHDVRRACPSRPARRWSDRAFMETISDLILKQLYLQGNLLLGIQFARQMRRPSPLSKRDSSSSRTTSASRSPRAISWDPSPTGSISPTWDVNGPREAFEQCRDAGPRPFRWIRTSRNVARQTVTGTECQLRGAPASLRKLSSSAPACCRNWDRPFAAASRFSSTGRPATARR